jgi:hypothetical protein
MRPITIPAIPNGLTGTYNVVLTGVATAALARSFVVALDVDSTLGANSVQSATVSPGLSVPEGTTWLFPSLDVFDVARGS